MIRLSNSIPTSLLDILNDYKLRKICDPLVKEIILRIDYEKIITFSLLQALCIKHPEVETSMIYPHYPNGVLFAMIFIKILAESL